MHMQAPQIDTAAPAAAALIPSLPPGRQRARRLRLVRLELRAQQRSGSSGGRGP